MWPSPPEHPVLTHAEVHVWRASLALDTHRLALARDTLSDDEQDRARGFRFERDQHRFVAARGTLRTILGRYLEHPPRALQFRPGAHGKPALVVPNGTGVQFNIAHSGNWMLCAMTVDRSLGVDLERIQPDLEIEPLLRRFARQEIGALLELPIEARRTAFFACWTAKEAYIKARGEGLSIPLSNFAVTIAPDKPLALVVHDPDERSRWSLCRLEVHNEYAAALAVEGHGWGLCCWDWSDGLVYAP